MRGQVFGKKVGGGDSKVSTIKLFHGGCSSAAYPPAGQPWPRFLFSFWSLLRICNLNRSTRIRGQGFGKNVGGGDSKVSIIKLLHGGCSSAAYPPAGQHWPRFLFSFWSLLRMRMFKEFQT